MSERRPTHRQTSCIPDKGKQCLLRCVSSLICKTLLCFGKCFTAQFHQKYNFTQIQLSCSLPINYWAITKHFSHLSLCTSVISLRLFICSARLQIKDVPASSHTTTLTNMHEDLTIFLLSVQHSPWKKKMYFEIIKVTRAIVYATDKILKRWSTITDLL